MKKWAFAIHGGAGALAPEKYSKEELEEYYSALRETLKVGHKILSQGGSALEACVEAVCYMEDFPGFNAGKGSVLNGLGEAEMDASIMCGESLNSGGVTGLKTTKNPILAAKCVMENSPHAILSGIHGDEFCKKCQLAQEGREYFITEFRSKQLKEAQAKGQVRLDHGDTTGTVGAVAMDQNGNLASATSTGGLTNKWPGRVSDSAIIGAGTYAKNNVCAVSGTGTGDQFIKTSFAIRVAHLIECEKRQPREALQLALDYLTEFDGKGGAAAVDGKGNFYLPYNTLGMFRGFTSSQGDSAVGVFTELLFGLEL